MGLIRRLFGGSQTPRDDVYQGLRQRALTVRPTDLGLEPNAGEPLHGVVMDTGLPEGVATFVSFRDGSASLYLSTGGGVIGGGEHAAVRAACIEMLSLTNKYAQDFIAACRPVSTFPLPRNGEVFFYLLAVDGVYHAEGPEQTLVEQQHPFSALFNNCHAVLAELRTVADGS